MVRLIRTANPYELANSYGFLAFSVVTISQTPLFIICFIREQSTSILKRNRVLNGFDILEPHERRCWYFESIRELPVALFFLMLTGTRTHIDMPIIRLLVIFSELFPLSVSKYTCVFNCLIKDFLCKILTI